MRKHEHALDLVPQPAAKVLVRHSVLMFANEVAVAGERQRQRPDHRHIHEGVQRGMQSRALADASGPIPEPDRPTAPQHEGEDGHRVEELPELQPVAALEVGIGAGSLLRAQHREVGLRGPFYIEIRSRACGVRNVSARRQFRCDVHGERASSPKGHEQDAYQRAQAIVNDHLYSPIAPRFGGVILCLQGSSVVWSGARAACHRVSAKSKPDRMRGVGRIRETIHRPRRSTHRELRLS